MGQATVDGFQEGVLGAECDAGMYSYEDAGQLAVSKIYYGLLWCMAKA